MNREASNTPSVPPIEPRVTPFQRESSKRMRGPYFHGPYQHVPRYVCGPWNTDESGEREAFLHRYMLEANQNRTPFRGLTLKVGDGLGLWSHERPAGRHLTRVFKRNTFRVSAWCSAGFTIGFVNRWKIVYADTWIQSVARLTGQHAIRVAQDYIAKGREIVRTVR